MSAETKDKGASADDEKKVGRSDDKCMGNRRIRTILLSAVLLVFSIFACGWLFVAQEAYTDCSDDNGNLLRDVCGDLANGYNVIVSGLIITMVFSIAAIILLFIPNCENKGGRVAGVGLIIGGVLYCLGWVYYISVWKEDFIVYEIWPADAQSDLDAISMYIIIYIYIYGTYYINCIQCYHGLVKHFFIQQQL